MMKKILKNKNFNIFMKYTLSFGIIMSFICLFFIKRHINFIWLEDGLNQHFITLNYFKSILENLTFNTFTWKIGFGMDMFSNLSYYIIGDIFSYISILVPKNLLKYLYFILVPIRLYCTGITFLLYCKYKNKLTDSSVIGSIIYTFCGFALISSIRHPYFINAMIIFPLTLIGIEKFIIEDKKIFYILTVFLMFFNSFYFGYMNALVIGIYGIILTINKYKKDYKQEIKVLIKALLYAFIGILMCSMILLPTIYQFLNSPRTTLASEFYYDINYYRHLIKSLGTITNNFDNWSIINISSIVLFSLPIFLKNRKKHIEIFILMIILSLPLLSSSISFIVSGLNYPNNRYVYMLMFILSFITVIALDNKNQNIDIKKYLIILIIYLLFIIMFDVGKTVSLLVSIIIFILILIIYLYKDKIKKEYLLYFINLIVIIGIIFNSYYLYDVYYDNYISEFIENYNVEETYNTVSWNYDNFDEAIKYIKEKDKGFYNIGKEPDTLWNLGLYKNYNSINYFYSINSNLYNFLSTDLNNRENYVNADIKEFDNRTKINSLLGVKYFISNKEKNIYNYHLIKQIGNTYIYKNNNTVDFISFYNECINETDYEKLSDLEKEDSLLKYYIKNKCDNKNIKLDKIQQIDYKSNIKNNKITLNLDEKKKVILKPTKKITGELFLKIDNIKYKEFSLEEQADFLFYRDIEKDKYKKDNKWHIKNSGFELTASTPKTSKTEIVYDNNYIYNTNNKDILINLGYYDNYDSDIKIELSKYGIYTFDNLKLYTVPMNNYKENIKNLNSINFKLQRQEDNYISGNINVSENGIINFRTLYNKGWTVKIDNKKVSTFKNRYFLATKIKKGNHKIELIYKTPYLKEGIILSIIGFILFITISLVSKKKL